MRDGRSIRFDPRCFLDVFHDTPVFFFFYKQHIGHKGFLFPGCELRELAPDGVLLTSFGAVFLANPRDTLEVLSLPKFMNFKPKADTCQGRLGNPKLGHPFGF